MTSLVKFLHLPWGDRKLLVRAAALLLVIRLGLELLPFRVVRRFALAGAAAEGTPACVPVERIAWAAATAARLMPGATCLARALAAESLLRQLGFAPTLHIGVAKGDDRTLDAHAWVECFGKVVIGEAGVERYTRLTRAANSEPGRAAR